MRSAAGQPVEEHWRWCLKSRTGLAEDVVRREVREGEDERDGSAGEDEVQRARSFWRYGHSCCICWCAEATVEGDYSRKEHRPKEEKSRLDTV